MWCGSAAGDMLPPPMVVYKAKNLCSGWTNGEVRDSVYSAKESGWFDYRTFNLWFEKCFLRYIQKNTPRGSKFLFEKTLRQWS